MTELLILASLHAVQNLITFRDGDSRGLLLPFL